MINLIKTLISILKNLRPINYIRLVLYNILVIGYTIVHMDFLCYIYEEYINLNTLINAFKSVINLYIYLLTDIIVKVDKIIPLDVVKRFVFESSQNIRILVYAYKELYYYFKKILEDKIDTIKVLLIWKIKRSKNFFLKLLKNFLSKYSWFNNNIINF